mmetsp:Transcript_38768/g.90821  ORF Transcript_38768/g.90821 Transcript_38768/m.90821 type:complete len:92 (-) Transcript_38768:2-277(-)
MVCIELLPCLRKPSGFGRQCRIPRLNEWMSEDEMGLLHQKTLSHGMHGNHELHTGNVRHPKMRLYQPLVCKHCDCDLLNFPISAQEMGSEV